MKPSSPLACCRPKDERQVPSPVFKQQYVTENGKVKITMPVSPMHYIVSSNYYANDMRGPSGPNWDYQVPQVERAIVNPMPIPNHGTVRDVYVHDNPVHYYPQQARRVITPTMSFINEHRRRPGSIPGRRQYTPPPPAAAPMSPKSSPSNQEKPAVEACKERQEEAERVAKVDVAKVEELFIKLDRKLDALEVCCRRNEAELARVYGLILELPKPSVAPVDHLIAAHTSFSEKRFHAHKGVDLNVDGGASLSTPATVVASPKPALAISAEASPKHVVTPESKPRLVASPRSAASLELSQRRVVIATPVEEAVFVEPEAESRPVSDEEVQVEEECAAPVEIPRRALPRAKAPALEQRMAAQEPEVVPEPVAVQQEELAKPVVAQVKPRPTIVESKPVSHPQQQVQAQRPALPRPQAQAQSRLTTTTTTTTTSHQSRQVAKQLALAQDESIAAAVAAAAAVQEASVARRALVGPTAPARERRVAVEKQAQRPRPREIPPRAKMLEISSGRVAPAAAVVRAERPREQQQQQQLAPAVARQRPNPKSTKPPPLPLPHAIENSDHVHGKTRAREGQKQHIQWPALDGIQVERADSGSTIENYQSMALNLPPFHAIKTLQEEFLSEDQLAGLVALDDGSNDSELEIDVPVSHGSSSNISVLASSTASVSSAAASSQAQENMGAPNVAGLSKDQAKEWLKRCQEELLLLQSGAVPSVPQEPVVEYPDVSEPSEMPYGEVIEVKSRDFEDADDAFA